jgi:hypothetical protein
MNKEIKNLELRDYFAAHALQGLLASNWCADLREYGGTADAGNLEVSIDAYKLADAMLKAGSENG